MKNKAGRPIKYDEKFYQKILKEHEEDYSISQMATIYKSSTSTIKNWLKKGRENERRKSESKQ